MIKNFSDHAAKERTFLAWVRTAMAVMAALLGCSAVLYLSHDFVTKP